MAAGSSKNLNDILRNLSLDKLEIPTRVGEIPTCLVLTRVQEAILLDDEKSAFIFGSSGTGKTIIMVVKMLMRERLRQLADEKNYEEEDDDEEEEPLLRLRQLFVTANTSSVKSYLAQLKGSAGTRSEDMNDDSFVSVPSDSYPLLIPITKFMMMLDNTVGESFLERFRDSDSISVLDIMSNKEVSFQRFAAIYWPNFNHFLTRNQYDVSRLYKEIMSGIKGVLQHGEFTRLTRKQYLALEGGTVEERKLFYDAYEIYEKLKKEKHEFDMTDFALDLHSRIKNGGYEGDNMNYVYLDQVEDLSLCQVALFKHISVNIEKGFMFASDAAQTISMGADFRLDDLKHLFYEFFLMGSRGAVDVKAKMKEKGLIDKPYGLSKNLRRTNNSILRLAQSVMQLLQHFFPRSVDMVYSQSSQVEGETPILLEVESGDEQQSAFATMLNSPIILVRDEESKKEISTRIEGGQGRVFTIAESKGLEFQDVLLYNFFGTSRLKINIWRVIYEYITELDPNSTEPFPPFN